eukprot:Filipodium_phascolosomae@DN2968_c0_g1_i1.p1
MLSPVTSRNVVGGRPAAVAALWRLQALTGSGSRANMSSGSEKHTALYDWHVSKAGKMVPFAGWTLPVQYGQEGIMASHLHTRSKAGLFDVSHMGQIRIHGSDRVEFLEKMVVGDVKSLTVKEARLSLLVNENGGVKDDCIITARKDYLAMVVNAGCADKDIAHIREHMAQCNQQGKDVSLEVLDRSLLALQGPEAMAVLQKLLPKEVNLNTMPFMTAEDVSLGGVAGCWITRCGYTGEDGFEISVPRERSVEVADLLVGDESIVKPTGLGARDSLRLEAGLCLYGHDLEEHITPVEAALVWTIGKRRREEGGFLGAEVILGQMKDGVSKKRVGFVAASPPAPREEAKVYNKGGEVVGVVTSGTFSPSLQKPLGMAYVNTAEAKVGTKLEIEVRSKRVDIELVKMPFVPAHYYRVPA